MKKVQRPNTISRVCPRCEEVLIYKNTPCSRYEVKKSIKLNRLCKKCSQQTSDKNRGVNNCWYGKPIPHFAGPSPNKGIKQTGATLEQSRKNIKIAKLAQGNKSCYTLWVAKYGVEEADKRMVTLKLLKSQQSSGANNPMYGKPAPNGSGNGWKGSYKGMTFRSLRELIFLIECVSNNILFESCHALQKYRIPYIGDKGQQRNYFPDFFIFIGILVEMKPIKLYNTINVQAKKNAAEIFCKERGWTYELRDYNLDNYKQQLIKSYLDKDIIFDTRYEEKFKKIHHL